MFDNWAQRKIFGPKGEDIRGRWRKLPNGETSFLYSPDIRVSKPRMNELGIVARIAERCGAYMFLEGETCKIRKLRNI